MSGKSDRDGLTRRGFLRGALLATAAPWLPRAFAAPATASARSARPLTIDVRAKGARGDGEHDDTAAFQAAIDGLPVSGGTVSVPAGTYMIDASRAINLRSNVHLELAADARLSAIPNALPRSHVIKVWRASNVQISGGQIVGERAGHRGSKGEWGYGINIQASNKVSVRDIHIADCWGDGIWIGALGRPGAAVVSTEVTLSRVTCTNNRRQGLSIGPVRGVSVVDCTFSHSNGTKPEAGIDIEPQRQGLARDITISRCAITDNQGTGLELHANVSEVVVKGCTIRGNRGYGVLGVGVSGATIADNTIDGNGLTGVVMGKTTQNCQITGNTFSNNATRLARTALKNLLHPSPARYSSRDLRVMDLSKGIHLSNNTFD